MKVHNALMAQSDYLLIYRNKISPFRSFKEDAKMYQQKEEIMPYIFG